MAKWPALPWIRSAITQGIPLTRSYHDYVDYAHSQGLTGMRRQDYSRLYRETEAARTRAADAIRAPRTDLPSPDIISKRSTSPRYAGGYGSWVMVYTRPKGGGPMTAQPWVFKSRDPLTPEEAERRAGNAIAQNPYDYDNVVLGVGYIGTDQYVNWGGGS